MITTAALKGLEFGKPITKKDPKHINYLSGLQEYFGLENTAFLRKFDLNTALQSGQDLDTKYGIEHMIALNEDEDLIKLLNKQSFVKPNTILRQSLRIEKEQNIFLELDEEKELYVPVKLGNSYVINKSKDHPIHGLTIVTPNEIQKYL